MLTLQEILRTKSSLLDGAKVKLVRHKDSRAEYRDVIKDRNALLEYQKEQSKDRFSGCDYILSFVGTERKRSIFIGAFKVGAVQLRNDYFYYDFEPVSDFDDLVDRLVINWGNNAIAWHQWYDKQPKEVIEILPKGYMGNFPGLLNFVLEFDELQRLVENPEANYEWRHHLSAVNGIYMILDATTGEQYVGSANGESGIWQRWTEYAKTFTGGNVQLKVLMEKDPHYYRNFRYSVLQTLPSNITQREIVAIEALYKKKLGSRVHGLNRN